MTDKLHPLVTAAGREMADGKLDRREFLRVATLLGVGAGAAYSMAGLSEPAMAQGGTLYNPMYAPFKKGIGSLAWRDSWNLFDQIIISPGLVSGAGGQYKYYGVRVFNEPYLRQEDGNFAGYPKRTFVGDTYQDGYSDHFPVFLILVKELKK